MLDRSSFLPRLPPFNLLLNQLLKIEDLRPLAGRQHVVQHLQLLGGEDKVEQLPDADEEDEHDGEEDWGLLEGLDQPEGDETEQLQPGEEVNLKHEIYFCFELRQQ